MAEIEDVRPSGEGVKDALRPPTSSASPPASSAERVEIALDRQPLGKLLVRPDRIDGLVEADRVDPGLARISRELAARALGKADDADMRVPLP